MKQAHFADDRLQLINADWFKYYPKLKQQSFDCCLTDLPYGGALLEKHAFDRPLDIPQLESSVHYILKRNASFITFADIRLMNRLLNELQEFTLWNYHVWIKPSAMPINKFQVLPDVEFLLVFRRTECKVSELVFYPRTQKGEPYLKKGNQKECSTRRMVKSELSENKNGKRWIRQSLHFPNKPCLPNNQKTSHPCQKPIDLLRLILQTYTAEDSHVIDMFAGCGSTLSACYLTNRNCTGIEIDENYFNESIRMVDSITRQQNLFNQTKKENHYE